MKKKIKTIRKRICAVALSALMGIMGIIPSMPVMTVQAAEFVPVGIGIAETVGSGAMAGGMLSGMGAAAGFIGAASFLLDFYNVVSNSGKQGDINTYYYQGGDTYNTTVNYKVFNDYTKNTTVTTNYNYSFYNPVTNNYNYTNDYSYNPEYRTYYYTTNEGDTNVDYYVTDNTTYVSYYIIETNETTQDKFESYYEIYYELPDGRNSFNLSKEDIWGEYFLYDYTRYDNIPEDDGTTLGLWHLDGNLKDSSFWGNSAGSSYSSVYKDAVHEGGKYLGTSYSDYFTLPLDKVSLPDSWTLEWIQYVPNGLNKSQTETIDKRVFKKDEVSIKPVFVAGVPGYVSDTAIKGMKYRYYNTYRSVTKYLYSGASGFSNSDIYCTPHYGDFEYYALVKNGGSYTYYVNGVSISCSSDSFRGGGIEITGDNSGIRFYVGTRTTDYGSYIYYNDLHKGQMTVGSVPTSENFTDSNYDIWQVDCTYDRTRYQTICNYDSIIDEIRLSKGAIYTSDYTPSSQPFTTNSVLTAPTNANENDVAFMTNHDLGNVRIGGARPTYPANGDVYVSLKGNKVESVQQYQENGWYGINGAIYRNGQWEDLKGYDMSQHQIVDPDNPDGPDDPDNPDDPDKPVSPDNPDDPDKPGSIWDTLGNLIKSLFGIIEAILQPLIEGITSLITMITNTLAALTGVSQSFGMFLKNTFVFIPEDILSIIALGVMLTIFASVIKIFL